MVPLVDEAVQRVSSYASLDDWIEKNARSEREGIGVEHAELWYNPADEEEAACVRAIQAAYDGRSAQRGYRDPIPCASFNWPVNRTVGLDVDVLSRSASESRTSRTVPMTVIRSTTPESGSLHSHRDSVEFDDVGGQAGQRLPTRSLTDSVVVVEQELAVRTNCDERDIVL